MKKKALKRARVGYFSTVMNDVYSVGADLADGSIKDRNPLLQSPLFPPQHEAELVIPSLNLGCPIYLGINIKKKCLLFQQCDREKRSFEFAYASGLRVTFHNAHHSYIFEDHSSPSLQVKRGRME